MMTCVLFNCRLAINICDKHINVKILRKKEKKNEKLREKNAKGEKEGNVYILAVALISTGHSPNLRHNRRAIPTTTRAGV